MPDRLTRLRIRREQLLAQAADLAAAATGEERRLRRQAEALVGHLVTAEIEAQSPAAARLRTEIAVLLRDNQRARGGRAREWLLTLLSTDLPAPAAGEPSRAARSRSSAEEPPPEGDLFAASSSSHAA